MVMKFRTWIETNSGLGSLPFSTNRGSDTPASDEVKQTGLQPQIDSNEIKTKQKDSRDKILAIDARIKRFDTDVPGGEDEDPKINKFKELWEKFKEKWDEIKADQAPSGGQDSEAALGSNTGDQSFVQTMQQHPNMMLTGPGQSPTGPGTFGMS